MNADLLGLLRKTEAYFARHGLESPRREAELLLAHALGLRNRLDLYLQFERPISEAQLEHLRGLVVRRARREPWQHLVGAVEFDGVRLRCDRRALIPRPETEELVALVAARLAERPAPRIADLGTGTGAIALALARRLPGALVVAVERSPAARALAAENLAAHPDLAPRVELRAGDWLAGLAGPFDAVVANPPYVAEADWAAAQPEVRDHDPREALVAADAGLADLRRILAAAPAVLAPGGLLALECAPEHPPVLVAEALAAGWPAAEAVEDLQGRPRFVVAVRAP